MASRIMEFDMERKGQLEIGQEVKVYESRLPFAYYYTIIPAVAMSRNIEVTERLMQDTGRVIAIEPFGTREVVKVEFTEEEE